ncbi:MULTISPECIES: rhomboid family intramembrane serine protease [Hydrotalea]|uniref:rhomboid family intramembrane serine protease n=1 Tax=Hydrotalea TaxID=1004300 RepID=UPI001E4CC017|nr:MULTISPECIES: rhomboid family intramembrane serine protease [Hydrotalea]
MISITIIIIAVTCIVSFIAFSNDTLMDDLIFYPPAITHQHQWYRFITCGFIHADIMHLAFNMYAFYMFGEAIESFFVTIFGDRGKPLFLILYISSLVVCLLPTYFKNTDNNSYRSLGASGAVSAVVFAFVFLAPTQPLGLIFIPIEFPAFIFGVIYLGISAYLSKKGSSRINHSAHFWGAIYGIVFLIITTRFLSPFNPVNHFINEVTGYFR